MSSVPKSDPSAVADFHRCSVQDVSLCVRVCACVCDCLCVCVCVCVVPACLTPYAAGNTHLWVIKTYWAPLRKHI